MCGDPGASQSQWPETACESAAFLFNLVVGFAFGVCTCVTLCCAQRGVSREIIVAAEQLRSLPEGFRLENLSVEASLLDSDVLELLGTEGLAVDELTSKLQLRWATRTEFPSVARCSSSIVAPLHTQQLGAEAFLQCLQERLLDKTLGRREATSRWPLTGVAHPSDSCAVVFTEIAADLEIQLEIVSEVPGESIGFSSDGRLAHIPSLVRTVAWDERCSRVEESCALSPPGSAKKNTQASVFY